MPDQNLDRNPVEVLADEFAARFRRGERPSVAEYTAKYPDHAAEIAELFPSIVMMEQLKKKQESDREVIQRQQRLGGRRIERVGDYEIVREIGRGGMGVVFQATQASLGRQVALKVLSDSAMASEKQVQRFEREARAAAALHHTNIVPVFGVGREDDLHFYVMQYIDGVGLDEILAALRLMAGQDADDETDSAAVLANALRCGSFAVPRKIGSNSSLTFARETRDGMAVDETLRGPRPASSFAKEQTMADATGSLGRQDRSAESTETVRSAAQPAAHESFGPQYFKSIARIGLQVADALQYAHGQCVLHRDIKPGNLLLDAQGTVWVTDFGLAKVTQQKDLTKTGDIVGTLRYMAPEQLDGKSDQRADLYSLGLTLYELLTLQPACDDKAIKQLIDHRSSDRIPRPRAVNREIPADLETIVMKAIAADPGHRYQSAGALAEDLQRYLDDRPILARRVTVLERGWRWSRRNPAMAALSGTALALAVLVVVLLSLGYYRSDQQRAAAVEAENQASRNLDLAFQAFDKIIHNIGARGAPLLYAAETGEETSAEDEEEVEQDLYYETVVTAADAELLANLLGLFEEFAQQNTQDRDFGERTALAYRRIGDIQQRLRRREEAMEAYERALKLYERLAAEQPDRVAWVVEQVEVLTEMANTERLHGFWQPFQRMKQARELLAKQPESLAKNPRIRFAVAQTYLQMVLSPRRPARRRMSDEFRDILDHMQESLREAEEILVQLLEQHPQNANYRLALARCFQKQIGMATFRGQISETACEAPVELLQALVAEYPDDPRYRYELADSLLLSCTLEQFGGDRLQQLTEAVAIAQRLVEQLPGEPEYEDLLAHCLSEQGLQFDREQRIDEASISLAAAKNLREALVDRYPSVRTYRRSLINVLVPYRFIMIDQARWDDVLAVTSQLDALDPRGRWRQRPLPSRRGGSR